MLKINSVGNQTAVTAAGSIKTVAAEFAAAIGSQMCIRDRPPTAILNLCGRRSSCQPIKNLSCISRESA